MKNFNKKEKLIVLKCVKSLRKMPVGDYFMIDKEYNVDKDNYIWSECGISYRAEKEGIIHKYYKFDRVD